MPDTYFTQQIQEFTGIEDPLQQLQYLENNFADKDLQDVENTEEKLAYNELLSNYWQKTLKPQVEDGYQVMNALELQEDSDPDFQTARQILGSQN